MAEIVQVASGKTLIQFAWESIFEPLGMKNTFYLDDNRDLVNNRAHAYQKPAGEKEFGNMIRRYDLVGSAGIYSTIEDLYRWDRNFYNNKLGKGSPDIINRMHEEIKINDGQQSGYAFGIINQNYKGLEKVSHDGGHGGYRALITRYINLEFTVILLANRDDFSVGSKGNEIAEIFLRREIELVQVSHEKERVPGQFIHLSNSALSNFTGSYLDQESMASREVFPKDDTLRYRIPGSRSFNMLPFSQNEFVFRKDNGEVTIKFGSSDSMSLLINRKLTNVFKRYFPKVFTKKELTRLEGTYYSRDIKATYHLKMNGEDLDLFIDDADKGFKLSPLDVNALRNASYGGVFVFEANKSKQITGFKVHTARAKHVLFQKMK